jgi:hypothetical protein
MGILTFLKSLFSIVDQVLSMVQAERLKQAGRNEVELANAKETLEQVQAARGIEREVAATDLDDLAQRMRRFQRD